MNHLKSPRFMGTLTEEEIRCRKRVSVTLGRTIKLPEHLSIKRKLKSVKLCSNDADDNAIPPFPYAIESQETRSYCECGVCGDWVTGSTVFVREDVGPSTVHCVPCYKKRKAE